MQYKYRLYDFCSKVVWSPLYYRQYDILVCEITYDEQKCAETLVEPTTPIFRLNNITLKMEAVFFFSETFVHFYKNKQSHKPYKSRGCELKSQCQELGCDAVPSATCDVLMERRRKYVTHVIRAQRIVLQAHYPALTNKTYAWCIWQCRYVLCAVLTVIIQGVQNIMKN